MKKPLFCTASNRLLAWLVGAMFSASTWASWTSAWQAPQGDAFLSVPLHASTIRQVVTPRGGGDLVRIRLSNLYGTQAIKIGASSIGVSAGQADLSAAPFGLTFDGAREVELAPGQSRYSDPVAMQVSPMQRLAVSLHVTNKVLSASRHFTANEYVWTASGDQSGSVSGLAFTRNSNVLQASTVIVDRIDVQQVADTPEPRRVVAMFGDSITDGFMGSLGIPLLPSVRPFGKDVRYPDFLQRRAQAEGVRANFVSAALSGNRLLAGPALPMFGPAGRERLERDVITLPGVTDAIILIGINDLGASLTPLHTANRVIAELSNVVSRLHAAKVRVVVGTLLPSGGATLGILYGSNLVEIARQQVNAWIRHSGVPDAVVDFDACVRDPNAPNRLRADFDSSDHIHPSAAGYEAMARCVNLDLFR